MAIRMKILTLFLLLSAVSQFVRGNNVTEDVQLVAEADDPNVEDYKEERNHSEAIQRILRDFEKTLEDSKIIFDRSDDDGPDKSNNTDISQSENQDLLTNSTLDNSTFSSADNVTSRSRMVCNVSHSEPPLLHLGGLPDPKVILLNGSHYQLAIAAEYNSSVVNRTTSSVCSITLFFADWCDFSATAAAHYNALARAFPQLTLYAVDSSQYHGLNTHYGVMAVPTLLVFHNSRPLYKYNYTEYSLASFKEFVSLVTGLEPVNETEVTAEDWIGPVPSESVKPHNLYLWLATIFSALCGLMEFSKSPLAGQLLTGIRAAWREAEIQHEHND